ncbi:MAG: hypothetical protein AB1772_08385 [Candidatus Zixiibacteriota bacterium]
MRKFAAAFTLVLVLFVTPTYADFAVGSAFGTLTTAQALGQGKGTFGFGVGIADATSFVGTFAYGLSQYSDGRLKFGLIDNDGADTEITFGVDYKWQFWNRGANSNHPFDFATGFIFEYADFGVTSVLQFGGQLIGSYPVVLKRGGTISPYARFNARIEWLSYDLPPGWRGDDSDSNLEVGLNGGMQWQMTSTVASYIEFQIDGNNGIFLGIDFNVM